MLIVDNKKRNLFCIQKIANLELGIGFVGALVAARALIHCCGNFLRGVM